MASIRTWIKRLVGLGGPGEPPGNEAGQNGQRHDSHVARQRETPTHTPSSLAERQALWKDTPPEIQMREWAQLMDAWIARLHADPATCEAYAFLQRLLAENKNGQAQAPALPAGRQVEVSAQTLYRTFFTGEGNGDIEYFCQRIVLTNTVEQIRHNEHLIQSLAEIYGSETGKRALPLILARLTNHSHQNGQSPSPAVSLRDISRAAPVLGYDLRSGEEVCLSARSQGALAIGGTGTGKTTLLRNAITSDIAAGRGVLVIDPHGDLVRSVIGCMDAARLKDVILLDLDMASEEPFGLNPFEMPEPRTVSAMATTAAFLSHTFSVLWGAGETTPRLMMVLRAVSRTLMENSPNATLTEVPLLFSDDSVRANLVASLTNSSIIEFWKAYNNRSPREKNDLVDSTRNKITAFTDEPMTRHIFGQSRTTIDLRSAMDSGKIVLVRLNPQYEDASRLLAAVILAKLLMAAFSRADVLPEHRRPFMVFADEWQTYMSADMARLLAEARKFNLNVSLANQTLEMLDPANRAAALQVGTLISFRVSGTDSKILARSYDSKPEQVQVGLEPLRVPASDILTHLVKRGHQDGRTARYAQTTLAAFDHFVQSPMGHKEWYAAYDSGVIGDLILSDTKVQEGRKLLNQTLYACMSEAMAERSIPMLAIYLLACSQRNGMEKVFARYVKCNNHGFLFGPFSLRDFTPDAVKFGEATFINPQRSASYIAAVAKYAKKEKWMAEAVVAMLTELRYVMTVLSQSPVLVDTGQLVPKYQLRS